MIVIVSGVFQLRWFIIRGLVELVNYKKKRPPVGNGMLGITFVSDRSRHPI